MDERFDVDAVVVAVTGGCIGEAKGEGGEAVVLCTGMWAVAEVVEGG